ncbi:hypothetical protein [Pseudoxanthomonas sp. USHLN014]|uniref:hypothetical protein n=1 Tax=Pseudoxanthomonas sp. USHLN014 TaxID=3081297 RepID=UPI00301BAAD9
MKLPLTLALLSAFSPGLAQAQARPATSAESAEIRNAVVARLKDPDSAKIEAIDVAAPDATHISKFCGYVNAKNSFGGYAGALRFYGLVGPREDGSTMAVLIGIATPNDLGAVDAMCAKAGIAATR